MTMVVLRSTLKQNIHCCLSEIMGRCGVPGGGGSGVPPAQLLIITISPIRLPQQGAHGLLQHRNLRVLGEEGVC